MTYANDRLTGIKGEKENAKASDEGGSLEFHNANLFDQDEDLYGNLYDEGTGRRINNSTDLGLGPLAVRQLNGRNRSEDMLGEVRRTRQEKKADAEADRWLRENGFDWND